MARRTRRSMSQINVVPYIDVMLVLLVIFMVSAPMMQQGVINLPTVGKSDRTVDAEPLRVNITKEGMFQLSDQHVTEAQADVKALVHAVQEKLRINPQRPVVIAADKSVRYEVVMQAMDGLKQAQIARVGLMVQPGQ
jgi:biopolymer transport protein TolR